MKRAVLFALAISLIALSACTGSASGGKEKVLAIRSKYIAASEITLKADMTADYGDRVYKYKLQYQGSGERGEITVDEPARISGLSASINAGEVVLRFDGAILDTGAIPGANISPIESFPVMINAWKSGFIRGSWNEKLGDKDCVAVDIDISPAGETDKTLHRVWFDGTSALPVRAEISVNGFMVIQCDFLSAAIS